ncbi:MULTISPECIES: carbohydrate ABC transporter permease [Afifella]|uniref:Multiple sugar transport system permease protein n=2 Tax=Afifellaceae TaxID=2829802 RepID=A0A1G5NVF4_AFIMA|nr:MULTISPECIES: sugar ABC transporter permease [Afifella]MBK1627609.1 sugar ABC transporter permease [Afifella marina]MBK1624052.1 sugar ABC transporter permease [Afifella marina DSM 2698]MBK5916333.1 ABC transporter permease [Afifella marina]MCT8266393.1 sugar ABC transporter permease [Afifella sp. JA880]RAI20897.1 ABC transporter permease [Afifella marina DSM 2698]
MRSSLSYHSRQRLTAWLMIAPLAVGVLIIVGWPFLDTIWMSFTSAQLTQYTGDWVGLDNYIRAFRSPQVRGALATTIFFVALTVSLELVLGVLVALLLDQPLYGRRFFRALLILPWALPTVVNAMSWRLIYNPDFGGLNAVLTQIGLLDSYQSWLGSPATAIYAIAVADIWKTVPLVAMITLAALQGVPREQLEAAHIDGASPWSRFKTVTMPAIVGPLMVAAVLRTIEGVKVFDIVWVMTRGGPANSTKTMSIQVYQEAFSNFRAGSGASQGLLIVLVSLILINVYVALLRRQGAQ